MRRMIRSPLVFCTLLISGAAAGNAPSSQIAGDFFSLRYVSGMSGLEVRVTDSESGDALPARVVLHDDRGGVFDSYYRILPGIYTDEKGVLRCNPAPGRYTLRIYHGIDYLSQTRPIEIVRDSLLRVSCALQNWVPLRRLGWVNGDGHAHLYTDMKNNDRMLARVRQICRAQGVDFISTNQGWAGYGESDGREAYARHSDDAFVLYYGAEMPKYRTGHTWWLNLRSLRGYFDATMDTIYENQYYQTESPLQWTFERLPFSNIPDVELVPRFRAADGAVAIIPHPTSWWRQKRGQVEKYTTNVCEYLSFSLLAGGLWDGIVILGYDRDHYFYQNLWFNILNRGYRLTPVAELDGGYGPDNKFPYGSMRVYYQIGDRMTPAGLAEAVRKGRTFVTSGPIVFAGIDGRYRIGDIVPADNIPHTLRIEAYASGEADDFLSYLIVFRNGEIFKLWDVRDQRPRKLDRTLEIVEREPAWYAVKVYGKEAWDDPAHLDIMAVCRQIESGNFSNAVKKESRMALTSPFYFRPTDWKEPDGLRSEVRLEVVDPESGAPVHEVTAGIELFGERIDSLYSAHGSFEFTMPVGAVLRLSAPGYPILRRGLYLDYPPHAEIIEEFASGLWLERKNWRETLGPGQVPWEAFEFEKTRNVLSKVIWTIEMRENERDPLWNEFESLF